MQLCSEDAGSGWPRTDDDLDHQDPLRWLGRCLDGVPVPVVVVDAEGGTVLANAALRRLLQLDPAREDGAGLSAVGGRPARFLARTPGWQRVWKVIEAGATEHPELVVLEGAPGDRRHVEVCVTPGPEPGQRVVTLRDVTPIRALRQQVGTQVKVLNAARRQLQAAREEMRQAEAQFGELVGELEAATARLIAHRD